MAELGRIPAVGDEIQTDGGLFVVTALDKRRVAELRFSPREAPLGSADSSASPDEDSEAGA